MKAKNIGRAGCLWCGLILGLWETAEPAVAAIPAQVFMTTGQELRSQSIRWLASKRQYEIQRDSAVVPIPLDQVERLNIPKPANLDQTLALAAKSPATAVAALKSIVETYAMLNWDLVAGTALINAYRSARQPKEAVTVAKEIMRFRDASQVPGDLSAAYLGALIDADYVSDANKIIEDMIKSGSRPAAAGALLRRGDLRFNKQQYKEALIDGYLRVVVLFREISTVQPEALYSAAKCFKQLGQHGHADKMKKILMERYGDSEYAAKARTEAL